MTHALTGLDNTPDTEVALFHPPAAALTALMALMADRQARHPAPPTAHRPALEGC